MLRFHDRVVCKRRGVASLSHPITIRRRYRGFTSLWPQRDSKVSTSLLRTRQNGLGVRRVFRIPSSTATRLVLALRDSDRCCREKDKVDRDRQNYDIHLPIEDRVSIVAERFGENGRTIVVEISTNDRDSRDKPGWRGSTRSLRSFEASFTENSYPTRGLEDFALPSWQIAIGGC